MFKMIKGKKEKKKCVEFDILSFTLCFYLLPTLLFNFYLNSYVSSHFSILFQVLVDYVFNLSAKGMASYAKGFQFAFEQFEKVTIMCLDNISCEITNYLFPA